MRMVPALRITNEERRELERRAQGEHVTRRVAQRARIVLLAADGVPNRQIAMLVGPEPEPGRHVAQALRRPRNGRSRRPAAAGPPPPHGDRRLTRFRRQFANRKH